jgi:hypothetical protein
MQLLKENLSPSLRRDQGVQLLEGSLAISL